jgi:hypothetical protein
MRRTSSTGDPFTGGFVDRLRFVRAVVVLAALIAASLAVAAGAGAARASNEAGHAAERQAGGKKETAPRRRSPAHDRRRSRRCRTMSGRRTRARARRRCRPPRRCRTRARRRLRRGSSRRMSRRVGRRSDAAARRRRCRRRRGDYEPITETIDTATARAGRDFFGLHADHAFDPAYGDRIDALDKVAATGVGTLRRVFSWQEIEIAPGVYDFSAYDELVARAAAHRIRVLPVLFAPPRWRSSRPRTGGARGTYPPASNGEFGSFARLLVARYGPGGELWTERPDLPAMPIVAWQIWNEPNIPVYWPAGPNAAEYVRMLEVVGDAIREADPGARLVSAALPDSKLGVRYDKFLADMYEAGARGSLDFAAINPYSRSAEGVYRILKRAREVLDEHDDPAGLWVTEIGWASGGPDSRLNVGEYQQAHLIGTVLPTLVQQAAALRLKGVIYYAWQDAVVYPGGRDFWGLHTGLLKLDGSTKSAYWRFVKAVDVLTG